MRDSHNVIARSEAAKRRSGEAIHPAALGKCRSLRGSLSSDTHPRRPVGITPRFIRPADHFAKFALSHRHERLATGGENENTIFKRFITLVRLPFMEG